MSSFSVYKVKEMQAKRCWNVSDECRVHGDNCGKVNHSIFHANCPKGTLWYCLKRVIEAAKKKRVFQARSSKHTDICKCGGRVFYNCSKTCAVAHRTKLSYPRLYVNISYDFDLLALSHATIVVRF